MSVFLSVVVVMTAAGSYLSLRRGFELKTLDLQPGLAIARRNNTTVKLQLAAQFQQLVLQSAEFVPDLAACLAIDFARTLKKCNFLGQFALFLAQAVDLPLQRFLLPIEPVKLHPGMVNPLIEQEIAQRKQYAEQPGRRKPDHGGPVDQHFATGRLH
jgi:hypothetical protein